MEGEAMIANAFLVQACLHLEQDFLPRIRRCLDLLSEQDVWWRGSDSENSVGNLLLHLNGNVRQWIVSAFGGTPDSRDRPQEFAARGGVDKEKAFELLRNTVLEAVAVLKRLTPEELLAVRSIQSFQQSGLQAIFHVVEHFSYHTGQIAYVTKLRRRTDLKFYD